MSLADPFQVVIPSSEVRATLPAVLKRFRNEHASAVPVIFGSHRKPEAVVIPFELYAELLPLMEDLAIARLVRERSSAGPSVPLGDVAATFGIELGADN